MDTQNGQYGNQGGYQWDGTRWVPVSAHSEDPGPAQSHWPTPPPGAGPAPTAATQHGQDEAEPTLPGVQPMSPPAAGVQPSADSQPTGYLPRIAPESPAPQGPTPQPAPFSSPPASSAPPFSGPPRTHAPLPPGFGPEDMPDPAPVPSATPITSSPPGPMSAPPGPMSSPPGPMSSPPGPMSSPPGPVPVQEPQAAPGPSSGPPGPASTPPGQISPAHGTGYGAPHQPQIAAQPQITAQPQIAARPEVAAPPGGGRQAYQPSGLTAADLQWSTEPERGKRGVWKVIGTVVGVLVLLAGATAGGYFFRAAQDGRQPKPEPTTVYGDAKAIKKSLGADGFECANAFTTPNRVDLCFRESPEYQDAVGFQMIDKDRIGWLKLRVESNKPSQHPVKKPALKLFGTVLDQALQPADAKAAKQWLSDNLTEDYAKNEYVGGETGGVRMQLLPRAKQSALLWVRLTAASYLHAGDPALPKLTDSSLKKAYQDDDFTCRPSEGGVSCEKKADAGTVTGLYLSKDQKISLVRLTGTATGELDQAAGPTKEQTEALLGLILGGDDLAAAKKWVEGAFDGKAHRTVLSGVEVRVAPIQGPQPSYQVDVRPASW